MNLNQIMLKLMKNNLRHYGLLFGSILFAVMMTSVYGIIEFSPMVNDVIMSGGSTQTITLSMYGFNMLACLFFIMYAHSLFLKQKSRQNGILISLGVKRRDVNRFIMKEVGIITLGASLIALIMSIPVSFGVWQFLSIFLYTAETGFSVGWLGIVFAALFSLISIIMIYILNSLYINKLDVIHILKDEETQEDIKGEHYIFGSIGIFLVPLGIVLFVISSISDSFLGDMALAFLLLSLVGVYLIIVQITTLGTLVKKVNKCFYYKHIIFWNLLKQKGKQYTLALFVSTILVSISIFSIGFNSIGLIEGMCSTKELDAYDVVVSAGFRQKDLKPVDIKDLAENYGVELKDFTEFESLTLGINLPQYNQWSTDSFISETTIRRLSGKDDFDIEPGTFVKVISVAPKYIKDKPKQAKPVERIVLNSTTREEENFLDIGEVYIEGILSFDNFYERSVLVLDDQDYKRFRDNQNEEFVVRTYMYNVDDWRKIKNFSNDLHDLVAKKSHNKWTSNYLSGPIFDRIAANGYDSLEYYDVREYKGNELIANRWWSFSPYTKYHRYYNTIQDFAIYLLLMAFISIIAFISGALVIGIKIMNTMWQDKFVYHRLRYLGWKMKNIQSIVTKQVAYICFAPTVLGSALTISLFVGMLRVVEIYFYREIFLTVIIITLFMWLVQLVIFIFVKNRTLKDVIRFEYS